MAEPHFYPEGPVVLPSDDELRTLHKIAALQSSGGGTGTGDLQVYLNRDPAAPDNPAIAAISYNTTTQVSTVWTGAAWE